MPCGSQEVLAPQAGAGQRVEVGQRHRAPRGEAETFPKRHETEASLDDQGYPGSAPTLLPALLQPTPGPRYLRSPAEPFWNILYICLLLP